MDPEPPPAHYILATAGHVDHGKSSLVRALTGVDPDRLPEEKARGITIELGFAELRLSPPTAGFPAPAYVVGVVDVPGHEDYVRNMVAGVGSVDAALLVVAADDGWMPQTEEHLQILSYLGVTRGVVALTKADLSADVPTAVAAVRERLGGSPLADAAIVPTSVTADRGLEELRAAIAAALGAAPPQADVGKPRLPVDRVFTVKGVGTVVTGTLAGGTIVRGQAVVIQPGGPAARVRSVQTHGREAERGTPGSRVALNLPGVAPAAREARAAGTIARGDVVTVPELGPASGAIDVLLERSARAAGPGQEAVAESARPLRTGSLVRVHFGSGVVAARVRLLDAAEVPAGGRALARLRLREPVLALVGDRFIVRDWPERQTLAGGLVLDPDPPLRARRERPRQVALLAGRAAAPDDPAVFVRTLLARDGVADRDRLLVRSRFAAAAIEDAVAGEVGAGRSTRAGRLLVDAAWWAKRRTAAAAAVDAFHRLHPEHGHVPLTDLLAGLVPLLSSPPARRLAAELNKAVADELCRDGFAWSLGGIRRPSHHPALPPRLRAAGEAIRRQLADHPFDPLNRRELTRTDAAVQAMKFLIATGGAVDLGPEVVLSAEAYARAVETVRALIVARGPVTVTEIKAALNSSRRVAVPLCERLDRDGVTRRQGDLRVLRESGAG